MRILVMLTGGTIASTVSDKVINVGDAAAYRIISLYREKSDKSEFDAVMPYNILSENLTSTHWETLYNALCKVNFTLYDGIIITHGTDTLAFTSAFLAMAARYVPLPVVMVSADYPLEDTRSNGLNNFSDAVDFIADTDFTGVYVSYNGTIHIGTRLISADALEDKFSAAYGVPFGKMENGKFIYNENPLNVPREQLEHTKQPNGKPFATLSLNKKVLAIKPYPSIDYGAFDLSEVSAVLHYLYHSCTANANSLPVLIERCAERGIRVYISPLKSTNISLYASVKSLLDNGAVPLFRMTDEAAYAKVLLAVNGAADTDENLFYETIE